jgi:hypothetical protein
MREWVTEPDGAKSLWFWLEALAVGTLVLKVLDLIDGVCTLLVHYYRQPTY